MQTRTGIALLIIAALALGACASGPTPETLRRADLQRRLADVKLSKGQYEIAIREYKRSLALFSRDPETHFGLAEAYRRKRLFEDAAVHLERAIKLDPLHHEARLNLGVTYLQMERWDDAIAQNQALLDDATFPRPSRALVNMGWAYYKIGDLAQAKEAFTEALSLDPKNFRAALDLGIVLYDLGETLEALRYFQRVVEVAENRGIEGMSPALAEVRFHMGVAHVKLQQIDKAVEALEQSSEFGGEGTWGVKSREYLQVLQ